MSEPAKTYGPLAELLLRWMKGSLPGLPRVTVLAEILGFSRHQVNMWINQNAPVSADNLFLIHDRTRMFDTARQLAPGQSYVFDEPGIPLNELLATKGYRILGFKELMKFLMDDLQTASISSLERQQREQWIRATYEKYVRNVVHQSTSEPGISQNVG